MKKQVVQSMTGFARGRSKAADAEYFWEARSVNHRYLDIVLKLPVPMRHLEPRVRKMVQTVFQRGRIEISLETRRILTGNLEELNLENLDALAHLMASVVDRYPSLTLGSVTDLLNWPGILLEEPTGRKKAYQGGLEDCLLDLLKSRLAEGRRLSKIVFEKLEQCQAVVESLQSKMPELHASITHRCKQRMQEIESQVEPARIAQEIALLLMKSDVAEELDRLKSHLEESISLLQGGGPLGRRLDFLMQELNREANTLGAKATSTEITKAAIELKLLIEQSREQVQNIE